MTWTSYLCHLKSYFLSFPYPTTSDHQQTVGNLQSHNLVYRETLQYSYYSQLQQKKCLTIVIAHICLQFNFTLFFTTANYQ